VQQIATVVFARPAASADAEPEVLRQRIVCPRWFDEVRNIPIARQRSIIYSRTEDQRLRLPQERGQREFHVHGTTL
jgi:hypothetical protein